MAVKEKHSFGKAGKKMKAKRFTKKLKKRAKQVVEVAEKDRFGYVLGWEDDREVVFKISKQMNATN